MYRTLSRKFWKTVILLINEITISLLLAFLLISCDAQVNYYNEKLIGSWIVESLWIEKNNSIDSIVLNLIQFKSNKTCKIPVFDYNDSDEAKWEIVIRDSVILQLDSTSSVFNDAYTISFWSENGHEYMKLQSQRCDMLCVKVTYSPEKFIPFHR